MNAKSALEAINQSGILLVFPIQNKKLPPSLWYHFFPKTAMRWEWDDNGDHRVANLWHLREELSRSKKVVYTKWYQGRATFFSFEVFVALLNFFSFQPTTPQLTRSARDILNILEDNSPISSKNLKKICKSEFKMEEKPFQAALKELWSRLLIVGFGEVDDGAFPSLAIGATKVLFESLWFEAQKMNRETCQKVFAQYLTEASPFWKEFQKHCSATPRQRPSQKAKVVTYEELVLKR